MKRVLVVGAGRVAPPLVRYLLKIADFRTTVVDARSEAATALVAGHERGVSSQVSIEDAGRIDELVRDHDLVVSLLPAPLHPRIAEVCVRRRRHLVTTSYVSPAMREMDAAARAAGVVLLNEMGLDPGVDHMSAMRLIDDIRRRSGEVTAFRSYCGGLPAPEANDNPWGYKFSWSPRGVCAASKSGAVFLRGGQKVEIPPSDLFLAREHVKIEGAMNLTELEGYPNRDSLSYIDVYGLQHVNSMFRGTLRYPGWCETMKAVVDLELLDETPVALDPSTTLKAWLASRLGIDAAGDVKAAVAARLKIEPTSAIIRRFEWLGLFSDEPIPTLSQPTTALDVLAARMEQKMVYRAGELDMVVMRHEFEATFGSGSVEHITSTLIEYGLPDGDSAMSRTVGLPAAIGARLILSGQFTAPGVHVPVIREVYRPVLSELEALGVCFDERVRTERR